MKSSPFVFSNLNDFAFLTSIYILEKDLMDLILQHHYDNNKDAVFDNIEIAKHTIEVKFGIKFEKCERCYAYRHKESLCDLYRVIPYQWGAREQIKEYQKKIKNLKDEAEGNL